MCEHAAVYSTRPGRPFVTGSEEDPSRHLLSGFCYAWKTELQCLWDTIGVQMLYIAMPEGRAIGRPQPVSLLLAFVFLYAAIPSLHFTPDTTKLPRRTI